MASSLRNVAKLSNSLSYSLLKFLPGGSVALCRCFSKTPTDYYDLSQKERVDQFKSTDGNFENYQHRAEDGGLGAIDPTNRAFTYSVLGTSRFMAASVARMTVVKIISTLNIGKADLALAQTEVPISDIQEGECISINWRGAPAFVKCRTAEEIEMARAVDWKQLRDPQSDEERTQGNDPKWVCVMANCTHLGCIPISNAGNYAGFFCPCHGSHYDNCGRIRQGPAPLNLHSPPYCIEGDLMIVG